MIADQLEAITAAITELISPLGLLLLPIFLLLAIHFLSSDRGSFVSTILSAGEPDNIQRLCAPPSPVGVALFLVLVLFLLRYRNGGGGDDESDE
ncbi:hypothetical protein CFOL_v3_18401 [Cephalotus follicularis]|uniref:Uncharacterized protein n=1 Tax=Cephalotus follicularis TaxID=3775 RepID=A0A1Q3C480_CEPFO|nr:hypothetical protein CFOL_v3_18401 [Cephalotus follicularis]